MRWTYLTVNVAVSGRAKRILILREPQKVHCSGKGIFEAPGGLDRNEVGCWKRDVGPGSLTAGALDTSKTLDILRPWPL
jgi:hypothetical protein